MRKSGGVNICFGKSQTKQEEKHLSVRLRENWQINSKYVLCRVMQHIIRLYRYADDWTQMDCGLTAAQYAQPYNGNVELFRTRQTTMKARKYIASCASVWNVRVCQWHFGSTLYTLPQCVIFMILLTKQMCTNCVCGVLINYRFIIFQTVVIWANTIAMFSCSSPKIPNSTYCTNCCENCTILHHSPSVLVVFFFIWHAPVYMSNIEFWFIESWNHETKA